MGYQHVHDSVNKGIIKRNFRKLRTGTPVKITIIWPVFKLDLVC